MTQNDTFNSFNDSHRQPTQTELKTQAEYYYRTWAISVLPTRIVWNDKKQRYDKKFLCNNWSQWQTRAQTETEFQSLNWDDANGLTIILGPQAKNGLYLTVIDYDVKGEAPEEAKQKGLKMLAEFPKTRIEQTVNHGMHLFFWNKKPAKNINLYHEQSGVELLGCPHLCVIAPSHGYTPLNDCDITKVDDIEHLFREIMKAYDVADKKQVSITSALQTSETGVANTTFNGHSNVPRPCIQHALTMQLEHANGHQMRLHIAAELKKCGWTDQEIAKLFKTQKDYNYTFALRQVRSADPNYAASCKTIQDIGYCLKDTCPLYKKQYQQHQESEEPIELTCLNDIENPNYAGQHVKVTAIVSSTSVAYQIPAEITADTPIKDQNQKTTEFETVNIKIKKTNPINLSLIDIHTTTRDKTLKQLFNNKQTTNITINKYRTDLYLRVRQPIHTIQQQNDGKLVDEHGKEYKHYDIHITTDKPLPLQSSTKIALTGIPLPNPKNQRTTLLTYKVEFLDETINFDITKINKLYNKLGSLNTVQERWEWLLDNTCRYTQIIGRKNVAAATLLAYFTPLKVTLNNDTQRGWGLVDIIGDSTTGKSETVKKISRLLNAGMTISAETASMAGIISTTSQMDNGTWFVDWGFLPLMDGKLLAMDGCHKISPWEWAKTAEAEREGQLNIIKAGKASHPARTRQIKIYNAIDKEAKGCPTKQLSEFLHPIQAYPSVADPTTIARRDLAVFVNSNDVAYEQINQITAVLPEPEYQLLSEVLKWCWSGKTTIVYTSEALTYLLSEATRLQNVFHFAPIPIVSADMKFKLARLSIALAYLTLSVSNTEDYATVVVTREHIEVVVAFLVKEYTMIGLNVLAQSSKFEKVFVEDVEGFFVAIEHKLQSHVVEREVLCEILKKIAEDGRIIKDVLSTRFGLVDKSQQRPLLVVLEDLGLIRHGRGFFATSKLLDAYKVTRGFADFAVVAMFAGVTNDIPPVVNLQKTPNTNNDNDDDDLFCSDKVVVNPLGVSGFVVFASEVQSVEKRSSVVLDVVCGCCGVGDRSSCVARFFDGSYRWICEECYSQLFVLLQERLEQTTPTIQKTIEPTGPVVAKQVIYYKPVSIGECVEPCSFCTDYSVQYVLTGGDKPSERLCGVCFKQRMAKQSNIQWIRVEDQEICSESKVNDIVEEKFVE